VSSAPPAEDSDGTWLLVGMGVTNRAVAGALLRRGYSVSAVDDRPDETLRSACEDLGIELVESPSAGRLAEMVSASAAVVPAPGIPDSHVLFALADSADKPVVSELDLAARWDHRPVVAITGTNGKTTVVELVIDCLTRSGINAVGAGNTEVPLVSAIDDPAVQVFVVEASSFRLARTTDFDPAVATWINFAPDHLDIHASLEVYEASKAEIWARSSASTVAIANADDPVVMSHVPSIGKVITFGGVGSDWSVDSTGRLCGPDGPLMDQQDLWRSLPHDMVDALAAAATATAAGASPAAIVDACRNFRGLDHRVQAVGTVDGSVFYDDSKATTPHATISALQGFESAVLIAGGRNKEIDLSTMLSAVEHVVAVVAIGDSADEITRAFEAHRPVETASDMDDAVRRAARLARGGIPVLLSPGCASFDWYRDYAERGRDFARAVSDLACSGRPCAIAESENDHK